MPWDGSSPLTELFATINNSTNSWSVNKAGANFKHLRHTVCNLWTYVVILNFPPVLHEGSDVKQQITAQ
ncbi:hypothetical protein GOODEAATRI_034307 [Goodea atripinnis]|uniref:Uncharacterized protein n=1 Tax=Goodea atripinnis TaxID=208336 RepID=A0ABV0Q3D8_9TELE